MRDYFAVPEGGRIFWVAASRLRALKDLVKRLKTRARVNVFETFIGQGFRGGLCT